MSAFSAFTVNTNRREVLLSGKNVQFNSSDGDSFLVPIEYIECLRHIDETIKISIEEECPIFDLITINTPTLIVIIKFIEEYTKEPFGEIPKPLPSTGIHSLLRDYYNQLLSIPMVRNSTLEQDSSASSASSTSSTSSASSANSDSSANTSLIELLVASNFLDIPSLKQLIVAKIADSVRNKNYKETSKIFGLPEQIPKWEDLERIRTDYSFAFEPKSK